MNVQIGKDENNKFYLRDSSNRIFTRKQNNMPYYEISEKGGKTMDLHLRK